MTAEVFRHQHRVTYADCTLGNHVYYARYLEILEAARGEFFRHLGTNALQWQERDAIFPVIEVRLRFKSPARYDDLLTTEIRVTRMDGVRLNFGYRVSKESGGLILNAETFHACTGLDEKLKRLPEEMIHALQPYLDASEQVRK